MDPKFRSSFIPKKPLSTKTEGGRIRKPKSVDLVSLGASILFLVAIVASIGVYVYQYTLTNKINETGIRLTEESDELKASEINDYRLLDERLKTSWGLLRGHIITSEFFTMLEANTLHNVQFDKYEFTDNLEIKLMGKAANFNALALQADVFERQSLINDADYNDFTLDEDGSVGFKITASLNKAEINFLMQ